jgi:hypothetical protein
MSPSSTKGKQCFVFGRNGLWHTSDLACRVLRAQRPPANLLQELRSKMFHIECAPVRSLGPLSCTLVPAQLQNIDQVYTKRGGVHKPLLSLNEGPYKVVLKASKYFQVDIGGRVEAGSTDRLKPNLGSVGVTPALSPQRGWPCLSASCQEKDSLQGLDPASSRERPPAVAAAPRNWGGGCIVVRNSPMETEENSAK